MATLTSRLKLRKPDPTDVVNVATDINANYDLIDTTIGYQVCTSGTRPGTPFQGQTIFETDTGRLYIWDGATWDKILINAAAELYTASPTYGGLGTKNRVINGDFQVWQRGTTFTNPSYVYTADRWYFSLNSVGSTTVVSRGDGKGVSGLIALQSDPRYYCSWNRSVAGSSGTDYLHSRIEGAHILNGRQVTVSIKAWTASGSIDFGFRADQNFGTGGSPSASVSTTSGVMTATTTPQTFTWLMTLGTTTGKVFGSNIDDYLSIGLYRSSIATNGAAGDLRVTDLQVEEGPVATIYERKTFQTELANCQRYYWRITDSVGSNAPIGSGMIISATQAYAVIPLPVTFRSVPTVNNVSAPGSFIIANSANFAASAISMTNATVNMARLLLTIAGATANTPGELRFNSVAGAWIEFSAEI